MEYYVIVFPFVGTVCFFALSHNMRTINYSSINCLSALCTRMFWRACIFMTDYWQTFLYLLGRMSKKRASIPMPLRAKIVSFVGKTSHNDIATSSQFSWKTLLQVLMMVAFSRNQKTSLFPLSSDLIASLVLVKGVIAAHKQVEVINAVRLVGWHWWHRSAPTRWSSGWSTMVKVPLRGTSFGFFKAAGTPSCSSLRFHRRTWQWVGTESGERKWKSCQRTGIGRCCIFPLAKLLLCLNPAFLVFLRWYCRSV